MLEQLTDKQITFSEDNRPYIYPLIKEETKWMPNNMLITEQRPLPTFSFFPEFSQLNYEITIIYDPDPKK